TPGDAGTSTGTFSGDLRYCVGQANSIPGDDTIQFAITGTITLGSQLFLTDTTGATTITGPGAADLTVSGGGVTRVFQVNDGVTASLSGLTIADGRTPTTFGFLVGGGILSFGTLMVTDCTLTGNTSQLSGGGIASLAPLTVTDCTFTSDTCVFGAGGGIFAE